jgi:hypothetical protein
MKIVQTFWTGAAVPSGLHLTGGWLSPEYHWMAWALSVLQLRRFYDRVELVTDDLGKYLLTDVLQLPYTHVRTDLQTALQPYPQELWALAKIYAYSLQDEPFLHVDGDIFIWKAFEEGIERTGLVGQNFEIDFPFYKEPLQTLKNDFENIPACMLKELQSEGSIFSINAGVLGGNQLPFFKVYKQLAFGIIDANRQNLTKVPYNLLNICIEQFLYYCVSKERGVSVSYIIDNQGQFDPTYPGFANFHKVPYADWFIHCMADYKRQEVVVWHLANRLRQDYPNYYYRILRLCQQAGVSLHNKLYDSPELNPALQTDAYFERLGCRVNGGASALALVLYQYGKQRRVYRDVETLFSQSFTDVLRQSLVFDNDASINEETEPVLKQTLHFQNPVRHKPDQKPLDSLDMVLYDAFLEPKPIGQAIQEASQYFPTAEIQGDYRTFQNLVLDRIKEGMYLGTLKFS